MFNFLKKKTEIQLNGEPITLSDNFEFIKKLEGGDKQSIEETLKTIFSLILKRVFREMPEELRASFLSEVKLKYHKDKQLEYHKGDGLYCIKDYYTTIQRGRHFDDVKMEYDSSTKILYLNMKFVSLVETNINKNAEKQRCVVYSTPIQIYIQVDDNYFHSITENGRFEHISIGFNKFGIILPEFTSLNLQTKKTDSLFLYSIKDTQIVSTADVRHFAILPKRFESDEDLYKYMNTEESSDSLYKLKTNEFIDLFYLIHQNKNHIFKIKDNERFTNWTSCEKI